jgi:hypothetical protein
LPSLSRLRACSLVLLGAAALPAAAADGFRLRYPLSGTLGGEIVAPVDRAGWFGSVVTTHIDIDKVTGEDGHARRQAVAGQFATPVPIGGAVRTATYSGSIDFDARQTQTTANLMVGYVSEPDYGGGRLSLMLNLPYTLRLDSTVRLSGQTPTLSPLAPALPPGGPAEAAQAAAQAGFATAYQAGLAAQSAAGTVVVDGFGDAEVTGAWVQQQEQWRVVAGATLVLPIGEYDPAQTINVGFGNYYTLRTGLALAYAPSPAWTLGARASLGFNSRNSDNDIRSGNYATLDLAAAWRSPIGIVGPHLVHVQQVQDDSGGMFGANRYRATGAGLFFATRIAPLEAGLNLAYMQMVDSRNALSGSFLQLRLSKAF